MKKFCCGTVIAFLMLAAQALAAPGDLQITEIMFNPSGVNDSAWEWIEVRNITAAPIDLNGAWMDRIGDFEPPAGASPNISNTLVPPGSSTTMIDTVIPAGGIAVLFDGFFGLQDPRTWSIDAFKDAWGLTDELVIPVSFWPGLPNSGQNTNIGIWENETVYRAAFVDDGMGNSVIGDFSTAIGSVNYDVTAPWPPSTNGVSIEFTGNGDKADGANWIRSVAGERGAVTSVPSFVSTTGTPINSTSDFGNPGVVHGSLPTAPDGRLIVTEVMYNPNSSEPAWEWIEVFNNTGGTIDFAQNNGVLDDGNAVLITSPNLTSGVIPAGEIAVLYNGTALSQAEIETAWARESFDPDFGTTINFIPVTGQWDTLNNNPGSATNSSTAGEGALDGFNDIISIWASQEDYDAVDGNPIETGANPLALLRFSDVSPWPADNNASSIFLTDLTDPDGNGFDADGNLWKLSGDFEFDEPLRSFNAKPVLITGQLEAHAGGDVGSPGVFIPLEISELLGDFNEDGKVDAADYTVWRDNLGASGGLPNNGTLGDIVDSTYFDLWVSNFGATANGGALQASAVPEPGTVLLLIGGAIGYLSLGRRRSHS